MTTAAYASSYASDPRESTRFPQVTVYRMFNMSAVSLRIRWVFFALWIGCVPRAIIGTTRLPHRAAVAASIARARGARGEYTAARGAHLSAGMPDPEKRNRVIRKMLAAAGIPDFWTAAGPTADAQREFHRARAERRITRAQAFLLRLAFFAWGRRADRVCSLGDLLAVDRRTARIAASFVRGWCRVTSRGDARDLGRGR